jgi:hypothetical protein
MKFELKGITNYENPIGDIITLWQFLDYVWARDIVPTDGSIGCIIIGGYDTTLFDPDWMIDWSGKGDKCTLKELCDYSFDHKNDAPVQIRWCNK